MAAPLHETDLPPQSQSRAQSRVLAFLKSLNWTGEVIGLLDGGVEVLCRNGLAALLPCTSPVRLGDLIEGMSFDRLVGGDIYLRLDSPELSQEEWEAPHESPEDLGDEAGTIPTPPLPYKRR